MINNKAYEQQAMHWLDNDCPDDLLMTGLPLAALRCWYGHHSYMKTPNISPIIGEYLIICEMKLPANWYDKVLRQRANCTSCGQTYKIENLKICTRCQALYCYPCASQGAHDDLENSLCRCGGELTG